MAIFYEKKGCCWLLEQSNFNKENLFSLVIKMIKDEKKLISKIENMKKKYMDNVYHVIETKIKEII